MKIRYNPVRLLHLSGTSLRVLLLFHLKSRKNEITFGQFVFVTYFEATLPLDTVDIAMTRNLLSWIQKISLTPPLTREVILVVEWRTQSDLAWLQSFL